MGGKIGGFCCVGAFERVLVVDLCVYCIVVGVAGFGAYFGDMSCVGSALGRYVVGLWVGLSRLVRVPPPDRMCWWGVGFALLIGGVAGSSVFDDWGGWLVVRRVCKVPLVVCEVPVVGV